MNNVIRIEKKKSKYIKSIITNILNRKKITYINERRNRAEENFKKIKY